MNRERRNHLDRRYGSGLVLNVVVLAAWVVVADSRRPIQAGGHRADTREGLKD